MTISTTANTTIGIGNGVTTTFNFSWVGVSAEDIVVTYTSPGGQATILLSTQYSIALNAASAGQLWGIGGSVTYTLNGSPIPNGSTLTIQRVLPLVQLTSVSNQGDFYPNAIEQALDYLTMIAQDQEDDLSRVVRGPPSDPIGTNYILPPVAQRQQLFLGFDAYGNVIAAQPATSAAQGQLTLVLNAPTGGVTDAYAAFAAALTGAYPLVLVPVATYRLSQGITVPPGVTLYSFACIPGNPPGGTNLVFDNGVATCLTMSGGGGGNGTCGIRGFTVSRAAGSVPSGSKGVYVNGAYNVIIEDINSVGHYDNWYFKAEGTSGISANVRGMYSGAATDYHCVIDSWPELRVVGGRFGMNGTGDVNCNGYIKITGGESSPPTDPGIGPNGIYFSGFQFNQGQNSANYWIAFIDMLGGGATAVFFTFVDCHVEDDSTQAGIFSNSGTSAIDRVKLSGISYIRINSPFLGLNPATQPNEWVIESSIIAGTDVTLASSETMTGNVFVGNRILCPMVLTSTAGGDTVSLIGNHYGGNLTLNGSGNWGGLSVIGGAVTSGSIANETTSGSFVQIAVPGYNSLTAFTFGVAFGGSSTGITYGTQSATWQMIGGMIIVSFNLVLTSKGAQTGAATLVGLPRASSSEPYGVGAGSVPLVDGMTGLSGTVTMVTEGDNTIINLYQSSSTGTSLVTDANFTDTSQLAGTFVYPLG